MKTDQKEKESLEIINIIVDTQTCPQCDETHDNKDWNGYCTKNCFFGLPKF